MKKKQSSLRAFNHNESPTLALQLLNLGQMIEQYYHSQQRNTINLSLGHIMTSLAINNRQEESEVFDLELDVPYIQSQHYDSGMVEQGEGDHDLEDQNFTDQEEEEKRSESLVQISNGDISKQLKNISRGRFIEDIDDDPKEQQLEFVKPRQSSSKVSTISYPFSSTSYENSNDIQLRLIPEQPDSQLLHNLQQTAYFTLQKGLKVQRNLFGNQQNEYRLNVPVSKKMQMLNKIEKQKGRKQIAEILKQERGFVKKFLK